MNDKLILFAKVSAFIFLWNSRDCVDLSELAEQLMALAIEARKVANDCGQETAQVCSSKILES